MNRALVASLAASIAAFGSAGCTSAACCRVPCASAEPPPRLDAPSAAARAYGRGSGAIWNYLASRYDADRDGRIASKEYPRDPKTFARLDRDHDGSLTAADFRGPTTMETYIAILVFERIGSDPRPAGAPPPPPPEAAEFPSEALMLRAFERIDANHNGLLGEAELDAALARAEATPIEGVHDLPPGVRPFPSLRAAIDADGSGRLSRDEVVAWRAREEAKDAAEEKAQAEAMAKAKAKADAAAKEATAKDAETANAPEKKAPEKTPEKAAPPRTPPAAPPVGALAPDFTLASPDGTRSVTLSSFRGKRPVALIFGSYTCPPFRATGPAIRATYDRHFRDVDFVFVYVREAHAIDGRAPMPAEDQPVVEEPRTIEERRTVAGDCARALGFDVFTTVVDGLDGAVDRAYAAAPVRLYVVGRDGRVAYASGRGPFGLDAAAFDAAVAKAAVAP